MEERGFTIAMDRLLTKLPHGTSQWFQRRVSDLSGHLYHLFPGSLSRALICQLFVLVRAKAFARADLYCPRIFSIVVLTSLGSSRSSEIAAISSASRHAASRSANSPAMARRSASSCNAISSPRRSIVVRP